MLVPFPELLADAGRDGRAVGAFTAYDLETAVGVLQAAEERGAGAMLLVASNAFRDRAGGALVSSLVAIARHSAAPACVQLDHERDLSAVRAALELGVGAVMADGSALPYGENVAYVREAAALAAAAGAHVEAELGALNGDEDVAVAVEAGALTDPEEADAFVRATGADCLAVSIGNVHGTYRRPPRLDWPRLAAIRAATDAPLSLHGASGLPAGDVARAIAGGVVKVNVNTELRQHAFATLLREAPALAEGARMLDLRRRLVDSARTVAGEKLDAFASGGGAGLA